MNDDRSNRLVFRVAQLFLEGRTAEDVAAEVNQEFAPQPPLSRTSVFGLLRRAFERGMVQLVAPAEKTLSRQLEERYELERGCLHVVPATQNSTQLVSSVAASRAGVIIRQLMARGKKVVGLGFGAGAATKEFCEYLAADLQANPLPHKLKLIAISAGSSPNQPGLAPNSFFHFFDTTWVEQSIGLFAEPLVTNAQFNAMKGNPWIKAAFAAKPDIDILITSMGSVEDPHDKLRQFFEECGESVAELRERGWIANLQYRPFGRSGVVAEGPQDKRAVTLFELSELQDFVTRKDKHLLLMARLCRRCGLTKAGALQPLLRKEFRLFTELFIDTPTAAQLLNGDAGDARDAGVQP